MLGVQRPAPARTVLSLLLFALAAAGLLRPSPAAAEMTVSPLIANLSLKPGESKVVEVTVTSRSGDLDVEFEHADFGFAKTDYAVQFIEDSASETTPFSTRGWFTTPRRRYHVTSGRRLVVPIRVRAPENALPGLHLGAGFLRSVSPAGGSGSRIRTSFRSGPLVFVTVEGGSDPRPHLDDVRIDKLQTHGPLRPRVIVSSEGSTAIEISGSVKLTGRGRTWRAGFPSRYVVPKLPRTLRQFDGKLPELGTTNMPLGRYRLSVQLVSQPGNLEIREHLRIWVIPRWLVAVASIIAALIAAAAAWGAWIALRRYRAYRAAARSLALDDDNWDDEDWDEDWQDEAP